MGDGKRKSRGFVAAVYWLLRATVAVMMLAQASNGNYENVYICVLTLLLFMVPSFLQRKLRIELPGVLEIVILFFIFAAEILGEIREYYLTVPFWDMILHAVNGFLFAAIGFSMVNLLNEDKGTALTLSPLYMALAAFCFSMTIGVLWEFFEWGMDLAFGLDMQKDTVVTALSSITLDPEGHNTAYSVERVRDSILLLENGETIRLGVGGYLDLGLHDTMADLLVNLAGAVVFTVFGFFYVKTKGRGRIARMFIPKALKGKEDGNKKYPEC